MTLWRPLFFMLLNLYPPERDARKRRLYRKKIIKEIRVLTAVYHHHHVSKKDEDIANAIGISVKRLQKYQKQIIWQEARQFWGLRPQKPLPKMLQSDNPKSRSTGYRKHKPALYEAQRGFCRGCRFRFEKIHLTVDHIVPLSAGGSNYYENLQLLCGSCNALKGKEPHTDLLDKLVSMGIDPFKDNYFKPPRRIWGVKRFFHKAVHATLFFVLPFLHTYHL